MATVTAPRPGVGAPDDRAIADYVPADSRLGAPRARAGCGSAAA